MDALVVDLILGFKYVTHGKLQASVNVVSVHNKAMTEQASENPQQPLVPNPLPAMTACADSEDISWTCKRQAY